MWPIVWCPRDALGGGGGGRADGVLSAISVVSVSADAWMVREGEGQEGTSEPLGLFMRW